MEISTGRAILLVILALVLLAVTVWYLRRRYKRSSSSGNEETAEQRERAYREQRDRRIPLRKRALKTPLEAKVAIGLSFAVVVVVIWEVYSYMKTGSPTQVAAATETKFLAACALTCGVGIIYERHRQAKSEGRIDVTYEAQPALGEEEKVVTYYYDPRDMVRTENGPVVFERKQNRMFGLFRLPKLHGDDPRFRDVEDPRPPEDKVGLAIPSHARKVDKNHWAFRTKGHIVLDSAKGQADVQFLPADNQSREQRMQRQTDIDNLQTRVKELQARNAELEETQRNRREGQKNEIDEVLDQIDRVVSKMQTMLPGAASQVRITEENRAVSHSARDQNGSGDGETPVPPNSRAQNGQQRGDS